MKFWFKLSQANKWEKAVINRDSYIPAVLVLDDTPEIARDFEENEDSDYWPVYRFGSFSTEPGDFSSKAEAEEELYACLGESLYCKVHDC